LADQAFDGVPRGRRRKRNKTLGVTPPRRVRVRGIDDHSLEMGGGTLAISPPTHMPRRQASSLHHPAGDTRCINPRPRGGLGGKTAGLAVILATSAPARGCPELQAVSAVASEISPFEPLETTRRLVAKAPPTLRSCTSTANRPRSDACPAFKRPQQQCGPRTPHVLGRRSLHTRRASRPDPDVTARSAARRVFSHLAKGKARLDRATPDLGPFFAQERFVGPPDRADDAVALSRTARHQVHYSMTSGTQLWLSVAELFELDSGADAPSVIRHEQPTHAGADSCWSTLNSVAVMIPAFSMATDPTQAGRADNRAVGVAWMVARAILLGRKIFRFGLVSSRPEVSSSSTIFGRYFRGKRSPSH